RSAVFNTCSLHDALPICRIQPFDKAEGDGMSGVQMHHRSGLSTLAVHATVQKRFFGRSISGDVLSQAVEERKPGRVERSEADIGGRHQHCAVGEPDADIAGGSRCQPPFEQRTSNLNDLVTRPRLFRQDSRHFSNSQAVRKISSWPKFPDFSANAIGPSAPLASVQGTPGAISGPITRKVTPSAATIAPEVSPPATRKRFTPRARSSVAR